MTTTDTTYPTAVDLCASAGGLSYGLQTIGFNVRAAFETDPMAAYTYHENIAAHDDMALYQKDVTDVQPALIPDEIDLFAAGPPCQPYSSATGAVDEDDPRRFVVFAILEWITETNPKTVLIENVSTLARDHRDVLHALLDDLRDANYQASVQTLDAADYRVPQRRSRMFILGVRHDLTPPTTWTPPPVRTDDPGQLMLGHLDAGLAGYRTTSDALEDLPRPVHPTSMEQNPAAYTFLRDPHREHPTPSTWLTQRDDGTYELGPQGGCTGDVCMPPNHVEANHGPQHRNRMAAMPLGHCGSSVTERRLHPNEPAPTMTVSSGTPPVHYQGQSPEHPERRLRDVRRLTVHEVAQLQTFPPEWGFAGTKTEQFRQVGNAVPTLLAAHVGYHLQQVLPNAPPRHTTGSESTAPA